MENGLPILLLIYGFSIAVFGVIAWVNLEEKSMSISNSSYFLGASFSFPLIMWGFYDIANVFNIGSAALIFIIISLLAKQQVFLTRKIFTSYLRCIISMAIMCIVHYLQESEYSAMIMFVTLSSLILIFIALYDDHKNGRKLME